MDPVGIIWTVFIIAMAVVPAMIEKRLKKAAKQAPRPSATDAAEPVQPAVRRSVSKPLPSEARLSEPASRRALDSVPVSEGECVLPHPSVPVVSEPEAEPVEIDPEKMIIYAEILKPKFDE